MPTLTDLRKRLSEPGVLTRPAQVLDAAEVFVSDQRCHLTPKDFVESKLGSALARATMRGEPPRGPSGRP